MRERSAVSWMVGDDDNDDLDDDPPLQQALSVRPPLPFTLIILDNTATQLRFVFLLLLLYNNSSPNVVISPVKSSCQPSS